MGLPAGELRKNLFYFPVYTFNFVKTKRGNFPTANITNRILEYDNVSNIICLFSSIYELFSYFGF